MGLGSWAPLVQNVETYIVISVSGGRIKFPCWISLDFVRRSIKAPITPFKVLNCSFTLDGSWPIPEQQ